MGISAPSLAKRLLRRPLVREAGIFLAFCVLTVIMTWPWALNLRDAVTDPGDPYLISWIMWWDYQQTFHDPLHLFQAPVFYPYEYTLAFSEHNYGSALPMFPLYALGLRPLTVHGIAMLLAFALSGYGAFRLTRTLTGSTLAAWVAGVAFAFAPYRFGQMPHLTYASAGWLALLFEALALFARTRSRRRAVWLGLVFVLNALTSVHWFVLSLIPLGLSGALWAWRHEAWRDRKFWLYGSTALGAGALLLLPFFVPYLRVQKLYKMERGADETTVFSAQPSDWLIADSRAQNWQRLTPPTAAPAERSLFPGLLTPLLALLAFCLAYRRTSGRASEKTAKPVWLAALDALMLLALALALGVAFKGRLWFGRMSLGDISLPLLVFLALFLARSRWAYPYALARHADGPTETLAHGLLWVILGFVGSLGLNGFFHRFLFDYVFIFRSLRVPARWTMIALLGLSVLAGLGAHALAEKLAANGRTWLRPVTAYVLLAALLGLDLRAAPLTLSKGEADPDAVSLYLKTLPVHGGVVHLPSGGVPVNQFLNQGYTLRQADHRHPLVTAFSGFRPPLVAEIEDLSRQPQIPDHLLDVLEEIPASYLVLHRDVMPPLMLQAVDDWLARPATKARLRFLQALPGDGDTITVYAVAANVPDTPAPAVGFVPTPPNRLAEVLAKEPQDSFLQAFHSFGFPLYRCYEAAYRRAPLLVEYLKETAATDFAVRCAAQQTQNREFKTAYDKLTDEQFVIRLTENAGVPATDALTGDLLQALQSGALTRPAVLARFVSEPELWPEKKWAEALVILHYFHYLHREPEANAALFWRDSLRKTRDYAGLAQEFQAAAQKEQAVAQKAHF